jgi:hypothetical protein
MLVAAAAAGVELERLLQMKTTTIIYEEEL